MDDLFRRAAENFPLKEADTQWDAIGARLDKPEFHPVKISHKRHVIFIGLITVLLLHLPFRLFETTCQDEKYERNVVASKNSDPVEIVLDKKRKREEELSTAKNVIPQVSNDNSMNDSSILIVESLLKITHTNTLPVRVNENSEEVASLPKDKMVFHPTLENWKQIILENNQMKDVKTETPAVNSIISLEATATALLPAPAESQVAEQSKKKPFLGWYAGINTGISLSIVKGQQLSGPGFTAGLGLGYRLSPGWSLETGIKFSEKNYYSNGEYFKPKAPDPGMPADMKVVSVKSKTMLIEIPIKAKYNVKKTSKGQFFLTGGISTFVVGKEISDYIIYRNGINGAMHATYDENKSYLAAAIDVSAGYEKFFKNKQTLRLEPWIQIAQKGIGVGQLPVSGFGVQAGYFFHK